jgi:3-oxoadipate enol-lactonase
VTTPVLIAGQAAGSAIAVTFAVRHPDLVSGLVLCPPALSVTPDRRKYLADRSERARRDGMEAIVDQTLDASYPRSVIRDQDWYRAYRQQFLRNDALSYALGNGALAESTADRLATSVTCPCLLLAGTHDVLRPPDYVRAIARNFSNAFVDELNSAHIMSQQAPLELTDRIVRFRDDIMRNLSPAARG